MGTVTLEIVTHVFLYVHSIQALIVDLLNI
jgi:hypothetical protein